MPASACTSEAATTVCCGVSPVAALDVGVPRPTASPCWSNSDTMVWRICASVRPSTKYVSGQVKPSTDVWSPWYFERTCPDCASGEERGAVVTRQRTDAVGDLLEPETGWEREHGVTGVHGRAIR